MATHQLYGLCPVFQQEQTQVQMTQGTPVMTHRSIFLHLGQTLWAEPAQELQINKEISKSFPGLFLAQQSSATLAAPHPAPAC